METITISQRQAVNNNSKMTFPRSINLSFIYAFYIDILILIVLFISQFFLPSMRLNGPYLYAYIFTFFVLPLVALYVIYNLILLIIFLYKQKNYFKRKNFIKLLASFTILVILNVTYILYARAVF